MKPVRTKLAFLARAAYVAVMTFFCGLLLLLLLHMAFDVFDVDRGAVRETTGVVVIEMPVTALVIAPIDQFTDWLYVEPPWKYQHFRATRSFGQQGIMYYGGRDLATMLSPISGINDYYNTPWGVMYWHGTSGIRWLPNGWMPFPSWRYGLGRLLPDPGVRND